MSAPDVALISPFPTLGERHVAPASSLSKYPSPAETRSVLGAWL